MGKDEKYPEGNFFFFFKRKQEANSDLENQGNFSEEIQRDLDRWRGSEITSMVHNFYKIKEKSTRHGAENQFPINEGDGLKEQWEIKQDG